MGNTAISMRGLTKTYGRKRAVDGIDLDIESGEVFAIPGPNGAGTTTAVERPGGSRDRARGGVRGPCADGGYYLIGWRGPHPPLVREVTMSAPDTLAQTLAVAARDGLRVALLPPWYDVDDPADLARLADDPGLGDHTRAFLAQ